MSDSSSPPAPARIHVERIGGITETTVELVPGVTALVGPNATNRTSLLQALSGAIGSDRVTLKGDSSEGRAELVLGEDRFTRRLERTGGGVVADGDPYLDDPEVADLYAVLLEDNEVRRAVRDGDDLRDLVLRPVDTEAIEDRIETLVERRREIDADLDRLDALEADLSDLVERRSALRDEVAELSDRLAATRDRLDRVDPEPAAEDGTEAERRLADALDSLHEARSDLEEIENELTIERKSRRSLREERERVEEQYGTLPAADEERLASLAARIDTLRERTRSLESAISELQQVVRFNEERLEQSDDSPLDDPADADADVTDDLLPEGTVTCWTCGSEVQRTQIRETVDRLREVVRERTAERRRLSAEVSDLVDERDEIERRREERDRLSRRLDEIDAKLDRREETIETLERRRESAADRIAELEREVESLQDAQQDELLERQRRASELELERDRTREELADVEERIDSIEAELDDREALRSRRESVAEELASLRTRIDRLEADAVEAFNSHMAALVDALGYDNVERIWLESTERPASEGGREVVEGTFDLHVVREAEGGTVYEDTVDHLSASEREVVGLVVALAGYLVHDVAEQVPFMLLDALEMIDGERLAELVGYLDDHVPYLVVVLLPDHVDAFERSDTTIDRRITDI